MPRQIITGTKETNEDRLLMSDSIRPRFLTDYIGQEKAKQNLKISMDAAKMRGVEAQLLIFPDENHWVLKPQNGILWQRTFFAWLDKYLK